MRNLYEKIFKKVNKYEDTPEARVCWALIMLGSFLIFIVILNIFAGGCYV